ncbi:MAG: [FeFe] hydrogenase H-cluster radical SAM maturase HydE, partial [Oscillospiraceae bacterium]
MKSLVNKLNTEKILSREEFKLLIENRSEISDYLFEKSRAVSLSVFKNKIYVRGLIEISSFCKNNCYYCGIRHDNKNAERYTLSIEEILSCCEAGYTLGYRTFVLQGGENGGYSDEKIAELVSQIRKSYPDCAITLSLGEKPKAVYQSFFDAGADRYLLRHETADEAHYRLLHPPEMSLSVRKQCLFDLKEIGYQTGTGFMVGSPFQTVENIVSDLLFIHRLNPEMIGIGPYVTHKDTPFSDKKSGSWELTVFLIGVLRLMLPHSLIPATTALATLSDTGR